MILVGNYPFVDDGQQHSVLRKIMAGQYAVPPNLPLSDSVKDLIRQMLHVDPLQRISIAGIKQHRWFTTELPVALEVCSFPLHEVFAK